MNYIWDWGIIFNYYKALECGILNSLLISIVSIILGSILGISILYLQTLSKSKIIRTLTSCFVEFFLAVPLLVLLFWLYYCLPLFLNIKIPAITTCIIAMSLNLAPFVSETIRAGLDSIPKEYIEAGFGLNLNKKQILKHILIPQVIIEMIPALITQYISLFKLSSLASVISVNEILHTANNIISETYRPLEVFTIVALIYALIIVPLSMLAKRLEHRDGVSKN